MSQNIQLSPEQIVSAAKAGVELLETKGAVNVPSTMSLTGDIPVLHAFLSALANGSVVLGSPAAPPSDDAGKDESKED